MLAKYGPAIVRPKRTLTLLKEKERATVLIGKQRRRSEDTDDDRENDDLGSPRVPLTAAAADVVGTISVGPGTVEAPCKNPGVAPSAGRGVVVNAVAGKDESLSPPLVAASRSSRSGKRRRADTIDEDEENRVQEEDGGRGEVVEEIRAGRMVVKKRALQRGDSQSSLSIPASVSPALTDESCSPPSSARSWREIAAFPVTPVPAGRSTRRGDSEGGVTIAIHGVKEEKGTRK